MNLNKIKYDFIVIGGGIIGLSSAMQILKKFPDKKLLLIEKEKKLAFHQSGHNSGVIHAGVYYEPGSLKAKFCKIGVHKTIEFCSKYQIPFEQCGKLIVATSTKELKGLSSLEERCRLNGLNPIRINRNELKNIEPNIDGLEAIKVKETGIVDYVRMCEVMGKIIYDRGGQILLGSKVTKIVENEKGVKIQINADQKHMIETNFLVCCGGLQSDRLAKMAGLKINYKIIPFRGDYYLLNKNHNKIVNHLIYPVPDPKYPFLGVHLTKMIDGTVTVGPNAVLNISRESYNKVNFNFFDFFEMIIYQGFWKLILKNLVPGLKEINSSLRKKSYLSLCQKYCPSLSLSDLEPYRPGIRAQAVSKSGNLIHDFIIEETSKTLHVCNAPSPAATSSIPIGEYITSLISKKFS